MSYLKSSGAQFLRNVMSGFCITLGAHPPEAPHAPAGHVGHSTHGEPVAQVLLEAQGAWKVHTRCSGHDDQRGKPEVRRELVPRRAGKAIALPLPILECRRVSWADGPGWEDGAQWPYAGCVPQVSVPRKSCHLSQDNLACHFSLVWLKYQRYVWSQPVKAAGWSFCTSHPVHTDGRKKERKC